MDTGSLAAGAVQGSLASSMASAPGGEAAAPSPDAVARFEAAMGGQHPDGAGNPPGGRIGQVENAGSAEPNIVESLPPEVDPATSPGDVILRGLERMSHDFHSTVEHISSTVSSVQGGDMLSASDLMRMQFSLTQVTLQQDLVSKVAGKATQNLDTFLKNQ